MTRILVIDDDAETRATLVRMLEHAGHEVAVAESGVEGRRAVTQDSFDLVITDIIMPDKDGLAMILETRRDQPNLPIIAISGGGQGGSDDYLKIAKTFGADRICYKPFKPQQILGHVEAALAA